LWQELEGVDENNRRLRCKANKADIRRISGIDEYFQKE